MPFFCWSISAYFNAINLKIICCIHQKSRQFTSNACFSIEPYHTYILFTSAVSKVSLFCLLFFIKQIYLFYTPIFAAARGPDDSIYNQINGKNREKYDRNDWNNENKYKCVWQKGMKAKKAANFVYKQVEK